MAENKFKRFQSNYDSTKDESSTLTDNYMTDSELGLSSLIEGGIPYQGEATSDILNSMLRQITVITVAVADLMSTVTEVSSLLGETDALSALKTAIENLATAVTNGIIEDTLDTTTTASPVSDDITKALTSAAVKRSIKTPANYAGIDGLTDTGYLLDAKAAKLLKDKLDTEISDRASAITAANTSITNLKNEIKIKYLGNMTTAYSKIGPETDFLYIWKGISADWATFSSNQNNASLIPNVLTILTD